MFGATAHTTHISVQFLRTVFPGRLISPYADITWPILLPDLAVQDYFLWSCGKSKAYETLPAKLVTKNGEFRSTSKDL
jgi:hypothetical protein